MLSSGVKNLDIPGGLNVLRSFKFNCENLSQKLLDLYHSEKK